MFPVITMAAIPEPEHIVCDDGVAIAVGARFTVSKTDCAGLQDGSIGVGDKIA